MLIGVRLEACCSRTICRLAGLPVPCYNLVGMGKVLSGPRQYTLVLDALVKLALGSAKSTKCSSTEVPPQVLQSETTLDTCVSPHSLV